MTPASGPRTRFCQLCGEMEGYGKPGAIPSVRRNPVDLRHGPNADHPPNDPDGIGWYATDDLGFADAERQASLWAYRGLTLEQAIQEQTGWTPETGDVENNNTAAYLAFVVAGFDGAVTADTPMTQVLQIPAVS